MSNFSITGNITVNNGSTFPVTVSSVVDKLSNGTNITPSCPTLPAVVAPGANLVCTYTQALAGTTVPVGLTNVATATLSSGVKVVGSQAVTFGAPTTTTGNTANLDDDQFTGTFTPKTATGQETYQTPIDCSAFTDNSYVNGKASGTVVNKAILTWTPSGTADSTATAAYNCYRLKVTQFGTPTLTRTWDWTIDKDVNTNAITLTYPITGQLFYTVTTVRSAPIDSAWAVTGQVTVTNPAPKIANLTAFTATLGATPLGLVSCTGTAGQVGAAGSKVCSFSLPLPDGSTRVGTARAVVTTKAYTGSATINFANAVVTKINETSVDVTDTMTETAIVRHFPGMTDGDSEHYQIDVCEDVDWAGQNSFGYTLVNTARIDQPTNDSDTETVDVTCLRPDNITVTKTFIGSYDVDYNWEVTKTVNSPLNLFVGETGTFTWTIDVEKSDPIYSGTPKWRVDVTNEEEFGATVTVDDSLDGLVCPQAQDARQHCRQCLRCWWGNSYLLLDGYNLQRPLDAAGHPG